MTVQLDTGTPPPNRVELTSAAADVAVVTLIGEHDLGQYDTLAAVLARAGVGALNVIVDLTHCAFVDSITISLLLNTHAYVTGAGGGLSLVIAGRAGSPRAALLAARALIHDAGLRSAEPGVVPTARRPWPPILDDIVMRAAVRLPGRVPHDLPRCCSARFGLDLRLRRNLPLARRQNEADEQHHADRCDDERRPHDDQQVLKRGLDARRCPPSPPLAPARPRRPPTHPPARGATATR